MRCPELSSTLLLIDSPLLNWSPIITKIPVYRITPCNLILLLTVLESYGEVLWKLLQPIAFYILAYLGRGLRYCKCKEKAFMAFFCAGDCFGEATVILSWGCYPSPWQSSLGHQRSEKLHLRPPSPGNCLGPTLPLDSNSQSAKRWSLPREGQDNPTGCLGSCWKKEHEVVLGFVCPCVCVCVPCLSLSPRHAPSHLRLWHLLKVGIFYLI